MRIRAPAPGAGNIVVRSSLVHIRPAERCKSSVIRPTRKCFEALPKFARSEWKHRHFRRLPSWGATGHGATRRSIARGGENFARRKLEMVDQNTGCVHLRVWPASDWLHGAKSTRVPRPGGPSQVTAQTSPKAFFQYFLVARDSFEQ